MNFINFHAVNDKLDKLRVRYTKKFKFYMEQTDNTPAIFVEEEL